jgi:hypothetical protein
MFTFNVFFVSVLSTAANGPVKTLTYLRLRLLEYKYDFYMLLNDSREQRATHMDPRDFNTVIKVDTHVHLSAAMTSKHLLDFIKHKVKTCPNVSLSRNSCSSLFLLSSSLLFNLMFH